VSALKVCPQCGAEYPANARFCEIDGTALRSATPTSDLVGSIVADRYHVLQKLGEGGMGQVYLAEHVKMGRKLALKVMHPGMKADVDAIARFNREAANASRIAHGNVAAVYDFGETPDGIIYLAMEYVEGPPLTKVIEEQGALPPKRAAEIVRQAADALAVAHDMGIVHRDLKPDNIMIARNRDKSDCVKVVDFGIAKAAGNDAQKVTKTGLVVGTPEYMSPEQLAGDKLDGRSDIYSLALVAFNMLTGKLPFPGESAQDSMIMRLTDKPKPLAEMKPEMSWPAEVQAVMDKALERDVNQRYQQATQFGLALWNAVDRMPETQAMEVGTMVMGQIPPTRVSTAADSGSSAPPGAPAGPVTHGAADSKKSNKVPMMVGAAVVVAGIGFAAMKLGGGGSTAQPQSSPPVADSSASATKQAGAPTTPAAPAATKSAPPAAHSDARLRQLMEDATDSTKSAAVLRAIARIPLSTRLDTVMAGIATYNAYVYGKNVDDKKACDALKSIEGASVGTEFEVNVKHKLAPGAACAD